jgi:tight adherence protein B
MTSAAAVFAVAVCSVFGVVAAPSTSGRSRSRLVSLAPPADSRGSAWRWYAAGALAVVTTTWGFGVRAATVLAAIGAVGWVAARRAHRRRQGEAARAAVVEMCRSIAAEVRSGQPAGRALVTAGQLMPEEPRAALALCFAAASQGVEGELSQLLVAAAASPGLAGLSRLAACWQVAAGAGSALAPALDRIADGLQDEIDVRLDIVTALAAPRATVRLLAVLPAIGLGLGTLIGADPFSFLFGSPIGFGCLVGAVVLDLAGMAWARRIAIAATRS